MFKLLMNIDEFDLTLSACYICYVNCKVDPLILCMLNINLYYLIQLDNICKILSFLNLNFVSIQLII